MRIKRKYLVAIAIAGVLLGVIGFLNPLDRLQAQDNAQGRIAYVDVQQVFNNHPDKTMAEKELNEAAQSLQSQLEQKAEDLSKDEQKELLQEYQTELSSREQKLIQDVLAKIETAIQNVAEEKEVKLVLDKKNVIYGGYDMTQDVIDYIENQQSKAEEGEGSEG